MVSIRRAGSRRWTLTFVLGIGPEISQSIKDIYVASGVRGGFLDSFGMVL
jgi:hypothetical protein